MKIKIVPRKYVPSVLPDGCTTLAVDGKQSAIACFSSKDLQAIVARNNRVVGRRPGRESQREADSGHDGDFQFQVKSARGVSTIVFVQASNEMWAESSISRRGLTDLFAKAFAATMKHWGWMPSHLHVRIVARASTKWMGLSRIRRHKGIYLMWLNPRLLRDYSSQSIWRVIIHELAHQKRSRESEQPKDGEGDHDDRFCELLGMIDKIAAKNPDDCKHFRDDAVQ